jgi:hypothetical protein
MITIKELPKVGDTGLAIHHSLRASGWYFNSTVARYMRMNQISEAWFQTFDGNDSFQWFHGIVKLNELGLAQITQIG